MKSDSKAKSVARLVLAGAVITLVAYWAGARWGPKGPVTVEALPEQIEPQSGQQDGPQGGSPSKPISTAGLTDDEVRTVQVYKQAAPAVANIITRAVEYDFFSDA